MATITSGTNNFSPKLIIAWGTSQESRNVIHDIIGRTDPDVTLKAASSRSGTLEMLFETASAAETARGILANGTTFTISDSETWLDGFNFVMSGNIANVLEDTTRKVWVLEADFKEIIP
jgi:hypothetical protein